PSSGLKRKTDYDRVVDWLYDEKSNVGIASLSDTRENELMWAHYAGNSSGICIEYYAARLVKALSPTVHLVRMGYDEQPPRISTANMRDHRAAVRKILSAK